VSVALTPAGTEDDVLRAAAAIEQSSEHPLAAAIVKAARDRKLTWTPATDFQSITGKGARGQVDGRRVVVGNAAMLASEAIDATAGLRVDEAVDDARSVVYVAFDGKLAGAIGIADPIKKGAAEALADLRREGLRIVMLTGDARATAVAVGRALGFADADIRAEVLPTGKRDVIRELRSRGAIVAMAGDGINDAPALAEAHVGIAMGTGTDVAMESAGMTLVTGDLRALVRARRLSRATMKNIRQNLFLAFAYNAIGVPVAAGVLYPFVGLLVSPVWASAAMTFSSVSVIVNALRLRSVAL
jgi:Cu+-exporting ATPase